MTSTVSREGPGGALLRRLRAAALTAVLTGAAGSVGLMLHAGRRNHSRLLLTMFAVWVLSPFIALLWANRVAGRWSVPTRATLYSVMLLVALCSVATYTAVALGPPRPKPASVFVVVPPASWLLIAIVVPIAALLSRRRSRRAEGG